MGKENEAISTEELHKEIDLIQGCINRMANNSFLLKGWLVSVIAVIVALSPEELNKFVVVITLIMVTISFWYLDAFFLRTEKLYKKLYEWVLEKRNQGKKDFQYDLNPHRFDKEVESVVKVMFSKTLRWFYGVICIIIIIIVLYYLWPDILDLICLFEK